MSRIKFNRNVLLLIIAVPLLVAIGVIAGSYFTGGSPQIVNGNNEDSQEIEEVTIPLDEFVLNLEPTSNVNRYVRMEISLSTTHEDGVTEINENLEKIRDKIIHTMSKQTAEAIFDDENGTFVLKDLLKKSINDVFDEELINEVYITNIVMQ